MRDIQVCVVENGALRNVTAQYNTTSGDTMVNNRPFATAYPSTTGYAGGATWYINNETVTVMDRRYVKYGLPRVLGVNEAEGGRPEPDQGRGVHADHARHGPGHGVRVRSRRDLELFHSAAFGRP
mgnify:CR=1 FL=1